MSTFFIATKHPEYADQRFPPGSVVIDPWRYIPDQPDVTVRRIGQNQPARISILLPSRGRPDWFLRLVQSVRATVTHPRFYEIVVRLDDDDPTETGYYLFDHFHYGVAPIRYVRGPRTLLSECWNEAYAESTGEIVMHAGDDITFDTPGWDTMVRHAFDQYPDKILFAHGDDLGPHGATFGTHGFVHRRWVQTVGYFLPPLFSSDWNDVWLNELADNLGRKVLLPFVTEHHHYIFGKAERDRTHAEREERGAADDVVGLYQRTASERQRDTDKLKAVLA